MISAIESDRKRRPDLFIYRGAVSADEVNLLIDKHRWVVTEELKEVWIATGGLDFLESESIFSPTLGDTVWENVEEMNAYNRSEGLRAGYLLFHYGCGGYTAIRAKDLNVVLVGRKPFEELGSFTTLHSWYIDHVRAELGERYGL